jgi:asparagine synthase (glutamine-hydrolysing)
LDAGPLGLFVTDKVNSLMKRLSITGYRHYTEYQKWHREGFKKSSENKIFSHQIAGRNIYNMDHLKFIFDLHISGQKNYGHLI